MDAPMIALWVVGGAEELLEDAVAEFLPRLQEAEPEFGALLCPALQVARRDTQEEPGCLVGEAGLPDQVAEIVFDPDGPGGVIEERVALEVRTEHPSVLPPLENGVIAQTRISCANTKFSCLPGANFSQGGCFGRGQALPAERQAGEAHDAPAAPASRAFPGKATPVPGTGISLLPSARAVA